MLTCFDALLLARIGCSLLVCVHQVVRPDAFPLLSVGALPELLALLISEHSVVADAFIDKSCFFILVGSQLEQVEDLTAHHQRTGQDTYICEVELGLYLVEHAPLKLKDELRLVLDRLA